MPFCAAFLIHCVQNCQDFNTTRRLSPADVLSPLLPSSSSHFPVAVVSSCVFFELFEFLCFLEPLRFALVFYVLLILLFARVVLCLFSE